MGGGWENTSILGSGSAYFSFRKGTKYVTCWFLKGFSVAVELLPLATAEVCGLAVYCNWRRVSWRRLIYIYIYPNKSIHWGLPKPCNSGKWWIIPFYEGNLIINRSESTVTLFRQDPLYTLFSSVKLTVNLNMMRSKIEISPQASTWSSSSSHYILFNGV